MDDDERRHRFEVELRVLAYVMVDAPTPEVAIARARRRLHAKHPTLPGDRGLFEQQSATLVAVAPRG